MHLTIASTRWFSTLLFLLLCTINIDAAMELNEFVVSDTSTTNIIMPDYPDNCFLIIETWIPGIRFESTPSMVADRKEPNRRIIILQPDVQHTLVVSAPGFKNEILLLPLLTQKQSYHYTIAKKVVQFGSITIRTIPDSATVSIKGIANSAMQAPYVANDMRCGSYTFLVNKPYYQTSSIPLLLTPDAKIDTTIRLEPDSFAVVFLSSPEGATVVIDDVERGTTPLKLSTTQVGSNTGIHRYRIENNTFETAEGSFSFTPGRVTVIEHTLISHNSLSISTSPPGASVVIDSVAIGTTPLSGVVLSPGMHQMSVRREGFQPIDDTILISGSAPVSKRYELVSGAAIKWRKQILDNQLVGGTELRGLLGTAPVVSYVLDGSGTISSGIQVKVPLGLKMTLHKQEKISFLFSASLFGDMLFHENYFLIDMIGFEGGLFLSNTAQTSRLYLQGYFYISSQQIIA